MKKLTLKFYKKMTSLTFISHDIDWLAKLSYGFGPVVVVFFVIWFLVNALVFNWRPFTYVSKMIGYSMGCNGSNILSLILSLIWYVFYFLPFLLLITYGSVVSSSVKPYSFGIDFVIAIPAIIVLFALFQSYRVCGFSLNWAGKTLFVFLVILLVAVPVISLFTMDEISWMGVGFLLCWPSSVILSILIVIRRRRFKNVDTIEIPDTPDFREYIEGICIDGTDRLAWYDYIIVILVSALTSGIYILLFYKKEDKTAALATGILFFGIDCFDIILHSMKNGTVKTLLVTLCSIVLKAVSVSFSRRFWLTGHSVVFFLVLSYIISKFVFDFWCSNKYKIFDIKCEQVVDNLVLMTHGKNRVEFSKIVSEGIVFAIVVASVIVDGVLTRNLNFEILPFGISQQNFSLYLELLSISVGLSIAGLRIIYQLNGHVDVPSVIIIASSFVLSIVLSASIPMKNAVTLQATTGVTLIAIVCSLIILIVTMFNNNLYVTTSISSIFSEGSYESEKVVSASFILGVISIILCAVFPFVIKGCNYIGFAICSLAISIAFIISYCQEYYSDIDYTFNYKNAVFSVMFLILFGVYVGLMTSLTVGVIAGVGLAFIECILYSFLYTKYASWDVSSYPLLFIIIPSAVLAIASLVYTILSDSVVLSSIMLLVFTALFFGSLIYAILKKNEYEINAWTIVSMVFMALCLLAAAIYAGIEMKNAFLLITVICGSAFAVCFIFTVAIIANSTDTNSLVYTNFFFPIFQYQDGGIENMRTLNVLFVASQTIPYVWGLFACVFFSEPQFGFLGVAFSLGFMVILGCLLLCYADQSAMFALEYAQHDTIKKALLNVKAADVYGEMAPTTIDFSTIESAKDLRETLELVSAGKKASKRHTIVFNAQLSVSAQMSFEFTKNYLYNKFVDVVLDLEYLKENANWSAKERREIFNIYEAVKQQDTDEQAALLYYEYVEAQAKERMRILYERDQMGGTQLVLPVDIDPESAELMNAQSEMEKLQNEIRAKEQEQYRLQKIAERKRQEEYQRRLEEDRRRRQEEEEERRRIQEEKDKIAAERRRKAAEERRRKQEERRREEEQRAEEERRRLEEERRRAAEDAERLKQILARRMQNNGGGGNNVDQGDSPYVNAVRKLIQANRKFVDPRFEPTMKIKESSNMADKLSDCEWNRLEDMQNAVMENISSTRFIQGSIGDCYLVAAMSAIAAEPRLIEDIFDKPINNKAYISSVKFHRMGKVDHVAVDTLVPCTSSNCRPKFVHFDKKDDSYWPAIIEKAYAKYFGSYTAIQGGNSHTAMYYLTGEFPLRISFDKEHWREEFRKGLLWQKMKGWNQTHCFLCAGSTAGSDSDVNNLGIVRGHAYTILGLYEVNNTQLIKMRNTWGDTEWKGEWSDNDKRWTPELRRRLGIENKDDGVFLMPFRSLPTNFDTIYVLIRTQGLHRYVLETQFKPGELDGAKPNDRGELLTQWKFTFSQPTKMYVLYEKNSCSSLHQVQMKKTTEKFKNHYVGDTVLHEGVVLNAEVTSWIWNITETDKPWFFLPYREEADDVVNVCIQVYTDVPVDCERVD